MNEWLYGSMGRLVDFHPFTLHFNPSLALCLSFASIRDPSVRRNAISLQVGASKRVVRPPSCPTGDGRGRSVGRSPLAKANWTRQVSESDLAKLALPSFLHDFKPKTRNGFSSGDFGIWGSEGTVICFE